MNVSLSLTDLARTVASFEAALERDYPGFPCHRCGNPTDRLHLQAGGNVVCPSCHDGGKESPVSLADLWDGLVRGLMLYRDSTLHYLGLQCMWSVAMDGNNPAGQVAAALAERARECRDIFSLVVRLTEAGKRAGYPVPDDPWISINSAKQAG